MTTVLIIGASGTVGRQVVAELDRISDPTLTVRLASSKPSTADRWRAEGREAVVLDLNDPETFAPALKDINRVFLLTGYSAAMLYESKMLVDACVDAGSVQHLVHLGVFSSGRDRIPHFAWHDLIESYIAMSGLGFTHLHPNVIADTVLAQVAETGAFDVSWGGETSLGWVLGSEIAAVAAAVLREGPAKHAGRTYGLSPEVLTGPEAAAILSDALGRQITCRVGSPDDLAAYVDKIPDAGSRLYMESAVQTMSEGAAGRMLHQATVEDSVQAVLGRPARTLADWARQTLTSKV